MRISHRLWLAKRWSAYNDFDLRFTYLSREEREAMVHCNRLYHIHRQGDNN